MPSTTLWKWTIEELKGTYLQYVAKKINLKTHGTIENNLFEQLHLDAQIVIKSAI